MLKNQQLYQQLKRDIQLQHWQPSAVLTQQQLAEYYNVSRIVVRDALQQLINEGWLQSHGKAGIKVSNFTVAEANELCLLRLQLEPLALQLAAENLNFSILGQAEDLLAAIDNNTQLSAFERGDLNWQFHRRLYQECHKPHLLRLLDQLHQQVSRYIGYQEQSMCYANTSATEHRQLITLLRAGSIDAACTLLREHITTATDALIQYLTKT